MTTDFASAEDRRVHIHIRRASKNGTHEFVKVPCGEPLSGLRQHLGWFNGSCHCALFRTFGGCGGDDSWSRYAWRACRDLAEPDHDAANRVPLTKVNVPLCQALGKHSCKIPDRDLESAVTSRCLKLFAS
jgi:hypothetical protein